MIDIAMKIAKWYLITKSAVDVIDFGLKVRKEENRNTKNVVTLAKSLGQEVMEYGLFYKLVDYAKIFD